MTMQPWTQQPAVPPGERPPRKEKKNWWEDIGGGFESWKKETYPDWLYNLLGGEAPFGRAPGGQPMIGGMPPMMGPGGAGPSIGKAVGPMVGQAARSTLTAIPRWMGQHKLLTGLGGLGGYLGIEGLMGQEPAGVTGTPVPGMDEWQVPQGYATRGQAAPADTGGGLPQPGEGMAPTEPTFFTDESGQRWVYNEYTGAWTMVQPPRVPGLTPEQQMGQAESGREAQMERLLLQLQMEQQMMEQQATAAREQQAAGAAQQMAQMYAADPYKYWAQMGQGTPGAVARLTGGEVGAGEQFQQGVPLSTPSAQWWGNLLPSEQQQISGGLNWMGIDPQDWYAMYQRMIPGTGSRQMGPQWAR